MAAIPQQHGRIPCVSVLKSEINRLEDALTSLARLPIPQPAMWGKFSSQKAQAEARLHSLEDQFNDGSLEESSYIADVIRMRAELTRQVAANSDTAALALKWLKDVEEELASFEEEVRVGD